jgi:hypothetical protein
MNFFPLKNLIKGTRCRVLNPYQTKSLRREFITFAHL